MYNTECKVYGVSSFPLSSDRENQIQQKSNIRQDSRWSLLLGWASSDSRAQSLSIDLSPGRSPSYTTVDRLWWSGESRELKLLIRIFLLMLFFIFSFTETDVQGFLSRDRAGEMAIRLSDTRRHYQLLSGGRHHQDRRTFRGQQWPRARFNDSFYITNYNISIHLLWLKNIDCKFK